RFAAALVAREQFVPDVQQGAEGWRAVWRPVLAGADAGRFRSIAQAMPPACRALSTGPVAAPDRSPTALLHDFLTLAVDALVRSSVARPVALAARPVRRGKPVAAAFDSAHDAWLHALRADDGSLTG